MCYYYNYDRNVTMLAKPIAGENNHLLVPKILVD